MKKAIFAVIFLSILLMSSATIAQDETNKKTVQYYGVETHIHRDFSASHKITLIFDDIVSNVEYNFPSQIYDLDIENPYGTSSCSSVEDISGTRIKCRLNTDKELANKTQLDIEFNTTDSVRKLFGNFRFEESYGVSMPVKSLFAIIYLPPTGVLASDNPNESYLPTNGKTLTDGRHIMVYWEDENVSASSDLTYAVMYVLPGEPDEMNNILITMFAIISLIVIVVVGVFIKRSPKNNVIENVMPILNKEEKKVIDILRDHGGEAMQKIIVVETDFSKAKVSRLIKDLSERGIIEVVSIGKKNKIKLKAKLEKVKKEEIRENQE